MSKVLHVSKTANGGRFIGYQLDYLAQLGVEAHLALPGEGVLAEMAKSAGVRTHVIPSLGSKTMRGARGLSALLTKLRPDLIHTHFVQSTLEARIARTLSRANAPIFFQVPGPLHLEKRWSRSIDILTARKSDWWGPACRWSFSRYESSGISPKRLRLAYYGKDLDDYDADADLRDEARAALGVKDSDVVAMMVAHVYPPRRGKARGIKGHEDFIEAVAEAQNAVPHLVAVIVGGPRPGGEAYYERLQSLAERVHAPVRFTGPRSDVPFLYRGADLAVHPSLSENLGGAGESLLMKVPTITTNVGGFPDIIEHDITGFMVPPKCPSLLAREIVKVVSMLNELDDVKKQGRARVLEVGNARRNAEYIRGVYGEIVKAPDGGQP